MSKHRIFWSAFTVLALVFAHYVSEGLQLTPVDVARLRDTLLE